MYRFLTRSQPEATEIEMSDARELVELMGRFGRTYWRWVRACAEESGGGSPTQVGLLRVLECQGPLKMADLGRHLGVTPRNVTKLVDALEGEGLVRRKPVPRDRRATLVELSPRGAAQAQALFCRGMEEAVALFEELSEADREQLARLLRRLLEGLQRRGG
jgi:DNA-binding MarR family transcriptional regulator